MTTPKSGISPGEPRLSPQQFVAKWRNVDFGEKQASQEMFLDICALVGHPTPVDYGNSEFFTFEKWVPGGVADTFLEGSFGWEFKGSDHDLDAGLNQLLRYQVHLKTPPLLIVSSFNTIRIQTNFPGMETVRHEFPVSALDQSINLDKLRYAFFAPAQLRPGRSVDTVTKETADLFQAIVADMEQHSEDPERLARYLNQIVFCLYAEGAGLLSGFSQTVRQHFRSPELFDRAIRNLFEQMAGGGLFGATEIAHFNGDLFSNADTVELSAAALQRLVEATEKNWRDIEPSIFGTLFERALDASKRSHLGAHYTGADDIMMVVEPVVMAPLRREWETAQREVGDLLIEGDDDAARVRLDAFQRRLFQVEVLDPACGSGNFLYLALRSLLDLEKRVIDFAATQGWNDLAPTVKPDQMLGLEINPYAAELARTALWIGYIQWHQNNGFAYNHRPILTPLVSIRRTDAILVESDTDNPQEPEWPAAEFIIGNPPFLGGKLLRGQLDDAYVDALFKLYEGRVPAEADLVCYWFEKARAAIARPSAKRAGLLATQGIRGGANRKVLQRIKETGDIFLAWPDQPWVLDGAAVHTSIVGFDGGFESSRELDGAAVESINANLTTGADLTMVRSLKENLGIAFMGDTKGGPFDIPEPVALSLLNQPNPDGRNNRDVVRRRINGQDIASRPSKTWIIDFGVNLSIVESALYEGPFEYVNTHVRPRREQSRSKISHWWIHERPRPEMRQALQGLDRFIVTPTTAKHRLFAWLSADVLPDHSLIVIANDDDYTFGVLHSHIHEAWSLNMGTQLETRPRYTPTTCFETFPFPEPTDAQRGAIAAAAARLNELREGWLNPVDADGNRALNAKNLRQRTLTKLYNQPPTWLANAHDTLDQAVAAAYDWPHNLDEAAILERLLALNLQRSGPAMSSKTTGLEATFAQLAEEWRKETSIHSNSAIIVRHPAYQKIIAMGESVLPLIFRELENNAYHWRYALSEITGADPIENALRSDDGWVRVNVREQTEAWLRWGREQGYRW